MLRISLAVLHLIALVIGMSAIDIRARNLRLLRTDYDALKDVFSADAMWGISAVIWASTGLWRWFAATEKATSYYMNNHIFMAKMGLFVLILLLELWPMITLIRWRMAASRGQITSVEHLVPTAKKIAVISRIQSVLLVAMLIAAVMMARGYGLRG
jgi:putative membrane protein